jgi:hypothetical protein
VPPAGVLASAPVPRTLLGQASGGSVAFVAAPTGLLAQGASAAVVNPRTGERVGATVAVGGFDPVALVASDGDVVEVTLTDSAGRVTTTRLAVKRGTRPRVVRTAPEPRATDVPLNAVIRVVFTTPVTRTAAEGAVRLLRGGEAVAGTVRMNGEADVMADFEPATPLVANTDYELRVDASLRDVLGTALEAPVAVPFTTGATVDAPADGLELVYTDASRWYQPKTMIVYARPGELFAVRTDGSGRTQLTWDLALEPDVAADGRIAYIASADSLHMRVREPGGAIRTVPLPAPVAPEYAPRCPAWSPDMRYIAYLESHPNNPDGGQLRVVYADSTTVEVRPMPAGGCPSWSPDGSRLATSVVAEEWSEVQVISIVTGATSTVARNMAAGGWSPAGDALVAFAWQLPSGSGFPVVSVERVGLVDGRREALWSWASAWDAPISRMDEPYLTRPKWSHDGALVAFSDAQGGVYLLRGAASWQIAALPLVGQDPTFVPPGVSFTR